MAKHRTHDWEEQDVLSLQNPKWHGIRCQTESERFRELILKAHGREPTPAEYYAAGEVAALRSARRE